MLMMTTKRIPALLTLAVLLPLAALAQPRQNNLTVVPPPARIVSPVIDGAKTTFSIFAPQAIIVSWSFTFGPKRAADLTVRDGSDIKMYHNDISKKILGGDANFKIASAGRYRFKLYYESADCTWHLAISAVK